MADKTIQYTEEMVGSGHPTKSDTLNRLTLVEHNTDGTHTKVTKVVDPWRDVRADGAVGDGVTDDTFAIQAAINTGNIILIAHGTYLISNTLTIPSGRLIIIHNATVKLANNSNVTMFVNSDTVGGNTDVSITGRGSAVIDGNGANQTGNANCVNFDNVERGYVSNIVFLNPDFRAFRGSDCIDVELSGCKCTGAGEAAFYFVKNPIGCRIVRNRAISNGLHGIVVSGGRENIVSKNRCHSNANSGIHVNADTVGDGKNNVVSLNVCYSNGTTNLHHGIYVLNQEHITVIGNNCHDNAGDGILIRDTDEFSCTGNQCNNNGRDGVFAIRQDAGSMFGGAISGNTCCNNAGHGVAAAGMTELALGPNTGRNNTQRGLNLDNVDYFSVSGGSYNLNKQDGVRLINGCSYGSLAGVSAYNNTISGIAIFTGAGRNAVSGCNTCGNGGYGIDEQSGANRTKVDGCIATGNFSGQIITNGANSSQTDNITA